MRSKAPEQRGPAVVGPRIHSRRLIADRHAIDPGRRGHNQEVRQEKPTAENEGGGTHDGGTKPTANVVPIVEAKEGGKGREGALKTGDQE
jgi:hypothetical protein